MTQAAPKIFVDSGCPGAWTQFLKEQNVQVVTDKDRADLTLFCENHLPLITTQEKEKLRVDFVQNHLDYDRKTDGFKSELLIKAIGFKAAPFRLVDCTLGLGIDAVFMAAHGVQVQAYERNPLIFLCLSQAVENLKHNDFLEVKDARRIERLKQVQQNLEIHHGVFLDEGTIKSEIQAIYYDPMFAEKNKAALPRQEMRVFKKLTLNENKEDAEFFQKLLNFKASHLGSSRLVVKRSLQAEALHKPVKIEYKGKLIRYDVY